MARTLTARKPVEHPHQRSKPPASVEDIINLAKSTIPPDSETQESQDRRLKPFLAPPRKRGAKVLGFKPNTSPV